MLISILIFALSWWKIFEWSYNLYFSFWCAVAIYTIYHILRALILYFYVGDKQS